MRWLGYITAALMVAGGIALWIRWRLAARSPRRGLDAHARLRGYVGVGLLGHGLVIAASLWTMRGCLHERPLGIPSGSGDEIHQGRIATNLAEVQKQELRRQQQRRARLMSRQTLLEVLRRQSVEVRPDEAQQLASAIDTLGLPTAIGHGQTAAGSPFGTRPGGVLWLYRLRHSGDNPDANPRALPVLLEEVRKALPGLKVSKREEVLSMSDLPRHRAQYFPTLLFITGTGRIEASREDRHNLRDYLEAGGFVVADSSGGNFEDQFKRFIRQVLPQGRLRTIELDQEVFRGPKVLYQLTGGCPVYRSHGRQDEAEGVFGPDGRLMVFISPGDMGSAWASVAMGRSRASVERAFQMGTNLVTWSLNTVHDRRGAEDGS